MKTPKTRLKDYEEFGRNQNTLLSWLSQQIITQDQYQQMSSDLQTEYQDKISGDDVHLFDDLSGLLGFLIDNNLPVTSTPHEMMHGREATRLGYTVKYGCQIVLIGEDQIGYIPFTKVLEDITAEDFIKVISAPPELSKSDKEALDILNK